MATFTFDLLGGKEYLFTTGVSGSTPTSGSTYPEVNNYAELPDATTYAGEIYVVRTGSGEYMTDRKDAGLYKSNGTYTGDLGIWWADAHAIKDRNGSYNEYTD